MRKPLIAGNWKMNLVPSKVPAYFTALEEAMKGADRKKVDTLLAVPSPFLGMAREHAQRAGAIIASQTIHEKPRARSPAKFLYP